MRLSPTRRLGPLAVIGSNVVAPVGVLALGWSTTVLLGVFVLELVAVLFWSAVKIPFAAKRPNNAISDDARLLGPLQAKRGATTLPGPLPPVYLRNVPTLLITVFLLAPLEITVAFMVFGLADPTVTTDVAAHLLLGGFGVFVGRGVETWADYFREAGYREHSPRSVLLHPFKHVFGVGALLFVAGPLEGTIGSGALLALVVAGKLAYDLRTIQVERDEDIQGIFYRLYGSAETEIDPIPVAEPDGEPIVRARPSRRVAIADALYRGVGYTFTSAVFLCYVVAAVAASFGSLRFALVPLAVALGFTMFRAVSRYLRYGTLEYRCYSGILVEYDTFLEEPQARLERAAVTDLSVDADAVDRAFGTQTIEFDTNEDISPDVRLSVPDPEDVEGDDANTNVPLSLVHVEDVDAITDALSVAWQLERDSAGDS